MSVPHSSQAGAANRDLKVLESDVPLSRSLIWRLQREFYACRSVLAWTDDKIPSFITSNPFIAEIYAGIVADFLSDCAEISRHNSTPVSPENPLRILELGAGTGKFACLFLHHLSGTLRERGIDAAAVRYCMTDCSESLVQSWRGNSHLAEFVQSGTLQFDVIQVGEEITAPFVAAANGKCSPGPLVLIANYVFDSLPQDAFVVHDGQIFELLLTTTSSVVPALEGAKDPQAPLPVDTLSGLQLSYRNAPVAANRYQESHWNDILELYRSRLPAATILFPRAALEAIRRLAGFSDGRMLVLAADKGYVHEGDLASLHGPPELEWHTPECFSQMVNFDAIGKYFHRIGGDALVPGKHSAGLNICAFLRGCSGDQYAATKAAYRAYVDAFGPDDLFTLLAWLNAHMEEMTVPHILSALRLTRWDPVAFMRLFPVLGRQVRNLAREREDLREAVQRTWANHYPVTPDENVLAFQCAVILLELRFFEDAMAMFLISQKVLGPSAATSYNLGLCAQGLNRQAEALDFMTEACNLDPKFEPAQVWTARRAVEGSALEQESKQGSA
jgi:hypothetical protein